MSSFSVTSGQPLPIDRTEKIKRLSNMSEQEFRDRIVRPLFVLLGYRDGRELHGPDEEGKDILFIETDKFGETRIICVQTKRGKLNMSAKHNQNILTAITQLRTALCTPLYRLETKQQHYPDEVFLCASGTINTKARRYITSELKNAGQVRFLDADTLINQIDDKCPQLWYGISVDVFAHYDAIRKHVENNSEVIAPGAANDHGFVQLTFYRERLKKVKYAGLLRDEFEFEELHVAELVNRTRATILIVGEAGAGKSTALWRIAYQIVRRDQGAGRRIPVLIAARDLTCGNTDIEQFLSNIRSLVRDFASLPTDLFRDDDIRAGRITLLVDGLDEITDKDSRESLHLVLSDFRVAYPEATVIVTSRPDSNTEEYFRKTRAEIYDVAPISWRQVGKIIKQVIDSRSLTNSQLEQVTSGAQEVLRRIEEVHGFQITPLLATIYAASAEYSRSDIPANITELFKKYSELMLGRWDEQKGLHQQFHAPLKDFVLRKIAYDMHNSRSLHMERESFSRSVQSLMADRGYQLETSEIEDELLNRSRLLIMRGGNVGFAHLLLQEFFAGRAIPESRIISYVDDPWWTKPVVFYYGDHPDRVDHLQSVQWEVMRRETQNPISYRAQGLALQASYLSVVEEKLGVWLNIVHKLADFMMMRIHDVGQSSSFPMTEMTYDYLALRDAVAFSALGDSDFREQILERLRVDGDGCRKRVSDARLFWLIVALLESGLVEQAQDVLRRYNFDDHRYYFWIRMGAIFIEKIVPVNRRQKLVAREIRERYDTVVRHLNATFFSEHRTLLLEKRQDKIVEVAEVQE